jgi:hemoglobin-like flavoprotein
MSTQLTDITESQKVIVQRSFRKLARHVDLAADLLYKKLFEVDPACRMLFECDMHWQGRKLMQMIAIAVVGLNTLETTIPAIQALGKRHVGYGIKTEDYESVGKALMFALSETLGTEYTPPVEEAWLAFYRFIAENAKSGAES